MIYSFNVIRIGSHCAEGFFNNQKILLVRTHIKLPNSLVQKWGNEYLSIRNFTIEEVENMISNRDESRFVPISAEISWDRHGTKYMKVTPSTANDAKYWITTVTSVEFIIDRTSLEKIEPCSMSQIFSIAFNKDNPKMFEATAILMAGDIIKIGNKKSVFCPINNPFLEVWITEPET